MHVLTFWGKVLGGGGQGPPAPPYATALQAYRENKALRSDKGVSLVGLDILCFKILIRFFGGHFSVLTQIYHMDDKPLYFKWRILYIASYIATRISKKIIIIKLYQLIHRYATVNETSQKY